MDGSAPRARAVAGLAALTVVGAALRGIGLDAGLWVDEIFSLIDSFRPPVVQALTVFPSDNQHPLYSLLANLASKGLGEANWAIRLPAAVFGAATVPLLYAFGRKVTTRREAFLAAALLAVSYHHVWFSQNARGYALLLFFAILASLFLVEGLRAGRGAGSGRWFAAYAVAAALGAYTHLTMIFVVAGQALVVALVLTARLRRRDLGGRDLVLAGIGFGGAAAVTLLFYAPILDQVLRFFLDTRSALEGISTPSWALAETLRVLGESFGGAPGLVVAGAVVALGLFSYWRSDPVALGLFVLPGAVTLLGALAARGTLYPRFFFPLTGFALLIGVRGAMEATRIALDALPRLRGRPGLAETVGTALLGIAIAASAIPTVRSLGRPKQDFVGAARWIELHVPPEDQVATVGVINRPYAIWMPRPWTPLQRGVDGALADLRRNGRRTWVVYAFPRYIAASNPDVLRAIRDECGPVERFPGTLAGGDIMICPLDPPESGGPLPSMPPASGSPARRSARSPARGSPG